MTDDLLTTTRDDLRAWDVPRHVPLMALRSTHVFPLGVAAVQVTSGTNVAAIRSLSRTSNVVVVVRGEAAAGGPSRPREPVGRAARGPGPGAE